MKRISKKAITFADIEDLCRKILDPVFEISLSIRGRLVLGAARILERKIHFIYLEAANAKLQMSKKLHSSTCLPIHNRKAAEDAITVQPPKRFDDFKDDSMSWMDLQHNFEETLLSSDESNDLLRAISNSMDIDTTLYQKSRQSSSNTKRSSLGLYDSAFLENELGGLNLNELDERALVDLPDIPGLEELQIAQSGMNIFSMGYFQSFMEADSSQDSQKQNARSKKTKEEPFDRLTTLSKRRIQSWQQKTSRLLCERPEIDQIVFQKNQTLDDLKESFETRPLEETVSFALLVFWNSSSNRDLPQDAVIDSRDVILDPMSHKDSRMSDDISLGMVRHLSSKQEDTSYSRNFFLGHFIADEERDSTKSDDLGSRRSTISSVPHSPIGSVDMSLDISPLQSHIDEWKQLDDMKIDEGMSKLTHVFAKFAHIVIFSWIVFSRLNLKQRLFQEATEKNTFGSHKF